MRILASVLLVCSCCAATAIAQDASLDSLRALSSVELVQEAKGAGSSRNATFIATSSSLAGKAVDPKLLYRVLREKGLYEPFGAVFVAAQTFGDAGSAAVPAAQTSLQTETLGRIAWESEHYWSSATQQHYPDFSFGGNIGFTPTLTLVNLTNQGTAVLPGARPTLQNAFEWDLTPRVNIPVFSKGEVSGFITLGQTLLTSDVISFKQSDGTTLVATLVSNNTGRAAIFSEYGAQFRLFNQTELFQTHLEKSYLTPAFSFAAGNRRDGRFNKSGDLADYDKPEQRYFFRMFISLSKVIRQKQQGDTADPITLDFAVDYDRPVSDSRVPAATRYTISSNVDVMKLFRPGAQ